MVEAQADCQKREGYPGMIGVALCGYGQSGRVFHTPLIMAEPRLSLVAVLRRSGRQGDEPAGVEVATDFERILSDKAVDLVVVNTPNALHYSMACAALDAGKHVVVEKPITVSVSEAKALIGRARARQRLLAVFHNRRLDAEYLTLARHLAANDLGRLVEVEWHYDRFRPNITQKAWKEESVPGAGTWFDLGIHLLDGMLGLFGAPLSVKADMRSLRRESGATDYFDVRFRYPDHRVILRSSTLVRELGPVLVAHGDRGSLIVPEIDVQARQLAAGILPTDLGFGGGGKAAILHTVAEGTAVRQEIPLVAGRYVDFYRNVARAIRGEEPLAFGPDAALRALDLAYQAIGAAGDVGHLISTTAGDARR